MAEGVGLYPRLNDESFVRITGLVVSTVQVAVLLTTVVLLQLSVTVNVRVVPCTHPLTKLLSLTMKESMPQLSVGTVVPRVASITLADGLHPRSIDASAIGMTGGMVSVVQVAVLLTKVVLPELSMAV